MVGIASIAGLGKEEEYSNAFNDLDCFIYYYPSMRQSSLSLADMLKMEVTMAQTRRDCGRPTYLYLQAVAQDWYGKILALNSVPSIANAYPDGQLTRLWIHYALASGANGYIFFNAVGLSGPRSMERIPAVAQGILEMRPLSHSMPKLLKGTFLTRANGNVYGTKLQSSAYDLYFFFHSDWRTVYHPATASVPIAVKDLVDTSAYQSLYQYSVLGPTAVTGESMVDVPEDRSLVLIAFKGAADLTPFTLTSFQLEQYASILDKRVAGLTTNMNAVGAGQLPVAPSGFESTKDKITKLLAYIDTLNELKRTVWLTKMPDTPTDGDIMTDMYLNGLLTEPYPIGPVNFYYTGP